MSNNYILTLSCPDVTGIVAAVTQFIAKHNGMIICSSQHGEKISNTFYMRVEIQKNSVDMSLENFSEQFSEITAKFSMAWNIHDSEIKKRMVILASKQTHCLSDLLYRWRSKDMYCDIPCVISNHTDMKDYVEWHNIPYHHVAMDKDNKSSAFQSIEKHIDDCDADVIVLARFMQILPPEFCKKYTGKIINIHHSFLPAFIGADPYAKAFDKGVKLVGATCHYVTEELDEGPIIEQDVLRVDHSHTPADMRRLGKDVEKNVLARGVQLHLQDRIIRHGNKTIVF